MAAISGAPKLVTKTYTGSQTVSMPFGVSRIESASGEGADGTPYVQGRTGYDSYSQDTYYPPNNGTPVEGPLTFLGTTYDASPPNDYCTGVQNQDGSRNETCYTYRTFDLSQPATTGASSTMTGPNGFSLTFPGGAGGPASVTNFGASAVVGGQAYSLTIPSGGFITITYYQ